MDCFMQKRRNTSALEMELSLFRIKLSIYYAVHHFDISVVLLVEILLRGKEHDTVILKSQ